MGLTGKGLVDFTNGKIGTPYVYGAKGADGAFTQAKYDVLAKAYPTVFTNSYKRKIADKGLVGKVCTDCSGLITWYMGSTMGSAQLYSAAYARLPMSKLDDFAIGTVLYKQGHVGVYAGKDANGKPICIEAKGIDYGTVKGIITDPNRWTCGLTFKNVDYTIEKKINNITYKKKNPYNAPLIIVGKGCKFSNYVMWVQFELIESGFGTTFKYAGKTYDPVKIDGDFGPITETAVKAFQTSCKIDVDGKVGPKTKKCFLADGD